MALNMSTSVQMSLSRHVNITSNMDAVMEEEMERVATEARPMVVATLEVMAVVATVARVAGSVAEEVMMEAVMEGEVERVATIAVVVDLVGETEARPMVMASAGMVAAKTVTHTSLTSLEATKMHISAQSTLTRAPMLIGEGLG